MKKKIKEVLIGGWRFKKEFRKQIRSLIIIALGFTIAFTWRQTFFDLSQDLIRLVTHISSSASLTVLTSSFITLFSVIIIYFTSKILKEGPENY